MIAARLTNNNDDHALKLCSCRPVRPTTGLDYNLLVRREIWPECNRRARAVAEGEGTRPLAT